MLEKAFQYNMEKGEWVQCIDVNLAEKDIENLHYALIVEHNGCYRNGIYVRCPKHREDEKIVSCDNGEIITEAGCKFEGLLGVLEKTNLGKDIHYDKEYRFVPFRWRIFQREDYSPINIAADVLNIDMVYSNSTMKWSNFSFSIDVDKRKTVISQIRCSSDELNSATSKMEEWTEATDIELPDVVADYVLELLRVWVGKRYGIKPSVLSQIKGKERIKAFAIRPFDLNIVFLKKFLRDFITDKGHYDAFDRIFPYEEKDNYKKVCEILDIKPPKSLRKAYTFNPYSIVWYMLFKQWRIKDVNLMQKFLYLNDNICGIYLHDLYYNKIDKKVLFCKSDFYRKWVVLDFYCQWLIRKKKVKKLLKWIYSVSTENNMSDMEWNILEEFRDNFYNISEETKDKLARDGLTSYVRGAIIKENTDLLHKLNQKVFHYDDNIMSYECKINQYEFHLVHDVDTLFKLGNILTTYIASYRENIVKKELVIVYLRDGSEYLACMEIDGRGYITKIFGNETDNKLREDASKVISFWAGLNELRPYFGILKGVKEAEVAEDFKNAIIEAIPYEKSYYDMSLEELLEYDKSRIKEGYYLRLQEKMGEANSGHIPATIRDGFDDEKSMLISINPQVERIYDAALAGNTEAMRALGEMYHKGEVIRQDNNKALEWLMKAASMNDKFAEMDAKMLGLEMGITGSLLNQDMLHSLRSMKPGCDKDFSMLRFMKYNLADVKLKLK